MDKLLRSLLVVALLLSISASTWSLVKHYKEGTPIEVTILLKNDNTGKDSLLVKGIFLK